MNEELSTKRIRLLIVDAKPFIDMTIGKKLGGNHQSAGKSAQMVPWVRHPALRGGGI